MSLSLSKHFELFLPFSSLISVHQVFSFDRVLALEILQIDACGTANLRLSTGAMCDFNAARVDKTKDLMYLATGFKSALCRFNSVYSTLVLAVQK